VAGPIGGNRVDRKGPTITVAAPSGSYVLNESVAAAYSCGDGASQPGSSVDTSAVGAKPFAIEATDAVGNPASLVQSYRVRYGLVGTSCLGEPGHAVLQPVDADGSSVFKAGSTLPVKFRVCDAKGTSIGTAGVVGSFKLVKTDSGTGSAVNEMPVSATPDASFRWDPSARQWIYNLSTRNLVAGTTYGYSIELDDGSAIPFQFGLR
jgi:hypothetical protein